MRVGGGLFQGACVAHLGAFAQRGVLRGKTGGGLVELGEPLGRRLPVRLRGRLLGLVPVQVAVEGLVPHVFLTRETGTTAGGDAGVAAVVVEEGGRGALRLPGGTQLVLLLVEGPERLGDVRDDGLIHRRQRFGQRP